MSVFGDIARESRYIDNKIYVSFDEENYRRLELKLKAQEQEIERLNNIIKEVREYIEKEDNQTKRGIYPNYWYEVKVKDILQILNKGE